MRSSRGTPADRQGRAPRPAGGPTGPRALCARRERRHEVDVRDARQDLPRPTPPLTKTVPHVRPRNHSAASRATSAYARDPPRPNRRTSRRAAFTRRILSCPRAAHLPPPVPGRAGRVGRLAGERVAARRPHRRASTTAPRTAARSCSPHIRRPARSSSPRPTGPAGTSRATTGASSRPRCGTTRTGCCASTPTTGWSGSSAPGSRTLSNGPRSTDRRG